MVGVTVIVVTFKLLGMVIIGQPMFWWFNMFRVLRFLSMPIFFNSLPLVVGNGKSTSQELISLIKKVNYFLYEQEYNYFVINKKHVGVI